MIDRNRCILHVALMGLVLAVLCASPAMLLAQEAGAIGRQTLGRPYLHVFVAYAVAWAVVLGWLIAVARRLRRVEERFGEE